MKSWVEDKSASTTHKRGPHYVGSETCDGNEFQCLTVLHRKEESIFKFNILLTFIPSNDCLAIFFDYQYKLEKEKIN